MVPHHSSKYLAKTLWGMGDYKFRVLFSGNYYTAIVCAERKFLGRYILFPEAEPTNFANSFGL